MAVNLRKPEVEAQYALDLLEMAVEKVCKKHSDWKFSWDCGEYGNEKWNGSPGFVTHLTNGNMPIAQVVAELSNEAAKLVAMYTPKATHLLDMLCELLTSARAFFPTMHYGIWFPKYQEWHICD